MPPICRILARWIATQPSWSDFPFILLTDKGGGSERKSRSYFRQMETLGNVTFLERPFHPTTLVSVINRPCGVADGNTKRVRGWKPCTRVKPTPVSPRRSLGV